MVSNTPDGTNQMNETGDEDSRTGDLSKILHIISRPAWASAKKKGELVDTSLASEGFIHCSYPNQVLVPANERFSGQEDLLLLVIEPSALDQPLVVEDSYGSGMAFPHIYGPINLNAIVREVAFPVNEMGLFLLPNSL